MSVPIFVNCRDRVTHLKALVEWLERAGQDRIILIDNDSTYPALLEYYAQTSHEVVRLGQNLGSRSIWLAGLAPDEPYVFTDPDLLPLVECPLDAVERFSGLLDRHPEFPKVGFGLYLEDLPPDFHSMGWERGSQINGPFVEDGARRSLIDTTFALYRPGLREFSYHGIRTEFPYQVRHHSWYVTEPGEEDRYYLERAIQGPAGSSWAQVAA